MKMSVSGIAYGLFLIIAMLLLSVIVLLEPSNNHIIKTKYCHIDSIIVIQKNDFIPETFNQCWTDCGLSFPASLSRKVGDSVEIKTIIVE